MSDFFTPSRSLPALSMRNTLDKENAFDENKVPTLLLWWGEERQEPWRAPLRLRSRRPPCQPRSPGLNFKGISPLWLWSTWFMAQALRSTKVYVWSNSESARTGLQPLYLQLSPRQWVVLARLRWNHMAPPVVYDQTPNLWLNQNNLIIVSALRKCNPPIRGCS